MHVFQCVRGFATGGGGGGGGEIPGFTPSVSNPVGGGVGGESGRRG